jgi:hypothetical protein
MNRLSGHQSTKVEVTSGKELTFADTTEVETQHDFSDTEDAITRIKVSGGFTRNLGNFESLRCDVSIELPCRASEKSIKKAFDYASNWVPDRLEELTNAAVGSINGEPEHKAPSNMKK